MTKREIAALAFTLAGIYVLRDTLNYVHYMVLFILGGIDRTGANRTGEWVGVATLLSVSIGMSAGLILARRTLARWMFPKEQGRETPRLRLTAVQGVAFSIVGVFVFASALPVFLSYVHTLVLHGRNLPIRDHVLRLAAPMGSALLGAALFFGGQGLARFWAKLRYAGVRREIGLCVRCGYDLTGNVSGVCPECGTQVETPESEVAGE